MPYTLTPSVLGGVESPSATDGTTAYFPDNELRDQTDQPDRAQHRRPATAPGVMVAIDQDTGKIKWQHQFAHTPYGAATVTNDLVFTTTFDGTIWALNKNTGAAVWHHKLPAGSNSPVAIDGDYVLTGAGFPEAQEPEGRVRRLQDRREGMTSSSGASPSASDPVGGRRNRWRRAGHRPPRLRAVPNCADAPFGRRSGPTQSHRGATAASAR